MSYFDSKGQGTVEYMLLLVVIISIAVGLLNHFFKPFGSYIKGVTSTEINCSLETGELMGSQALKDEGCVPSYEASAWDGRSENGRGDGKSSSGSTSSSSGSQSSGTSGSHSNSKNSKQSNSSGNNSSKGSATSSKGATSSPSDSSGSSSSSSGSGSSGRSKPGPDKETSSSGEDDGDSTKSGSKNRGAISRVVGRNGKLELGSGRSASDKETSSDSNMTYEIGSEENDKFKSNRGWSYRDRNKPRAITGYGLVEEEKDKNKNDKKNSPTSAKNVKSEDALGLKSKQLKLQNTLGSKVRNDVEENWSFGKWLRIAVIVIIIMGILIFLFFQVVQISKGFEKD